MTATPPVPGPPPQPGTAVPHPVAGPVPYPVPGPWPQPAPRTDGLAVASLVLALCGFTVVAVALGHLALHRLRRTGERGYGLAVTGLVLGYTTLAALVVVVVAVAGTVWWGVQQ
ncbi:DUF4190 domain-containing protein [Cellulomonas fimi]|uniref:DUF4190 domain-containing protein n=1 Tax=Cellulomonas fimi (strain ATCC 484 / DSM 20113 / JCM 1341 / CCUG 24087 / LMG 16345 / NBRC 15513 / NCIMB 8980 / NCTC 7547 / NRS-133) TaxID=590998 RepID=F4H009_CELFA|nr:DUF4190 domain-containing protein [Cellulomonas fimi]AEE44931.1 hypothetical protein Celf_0791 [Cellulomonas fimi ATCC 484]NNH07246.1 DUF4190 domain-containing protein [Cellulomonas fimi]VEH27716.1 Uncharacterised protein [Cellulomonas fimi]